MGAYARVGDADVMPGLRPEPLWPWHGRWGGRRRPTGAIGRATAFRFRARFAATRNECRQKPSTFQQWVHGAEAELDNEFVLDTVKHGPPTISSVMDELLRDGLGQHTVLGGHA